MTYRCRCGAHHQQPQLTIEAIGPHDHASFHLCAQCTVEARNFLLNQPAYPVDPTTPIFTLSDDEFDDVTVECVDDDLWYDLIRERVA